jgi:hypothetical protein
LGAEFGTNIMMLAMKDKEVDEQIKILIKEDKLKIVDSKNQPVYENEMKKEANMPYEAEK